MSERKKSVVPKAPETSGAMVSALSKVTGALDPDVAMRLTQQALSVVSLAVGLSEKERERHILSAFKLLQQFKPQNELEGILAVQMLGVHEAAMECLRLATLSALTSAGRDSNLKHAVKFMGLFTRQLEAFDRLRGKGQQKITVERVNVESGGQAIVGNVHANPERQTRTPDAKVPATKETREHKPSDAVNSNSSKKTKKKKKTASKKRA